MLSWGYIWRLWTVWVKKIVTFFFFFHFFLTLGKKNGATVSHLGSCIELPSQLAQTQVVCAHAVEQSIPSAQVTSLQSAQLFLPAL